MTRDEILQLAREIDPSAMWDGDHLAVHTFAARELLKVLPGAEQWTPEGWAASSSFTYLVFP